MSGEKEPEETLTPDLCIIGAGSAGLSVAAVARAFGASVVLIEKAKMGGDCLNTGCVPSKALIAAAKTTAIARHGAELGIKFAKPKIDFAAVHAHVANTIAGIAPHDSQERFEGLGATVLRAPARFVDPQTLVAGKTLIKARRFVIATGSEPARPPIPGLDRVPYLTNESLFDLAERPEHLAVIGAGPIGMEMAQAFVRLGTKVTVLEMAAPLAGNDPELAEVVVAALTQEGVDIRSGARVTEVSGEAGAIAVGFEQDGKAHRLQATHLLVATGRVPVTKGLDLEAAGVEMRGAAVAVDKGMRTTNRRIYAIGDVTGGRQFTHVASYHAGLVVRSALFGLPVRENREILPAATYTDPELAEVGLSEDEARARFGDKVRVVSAHFKDNDRARAQGGAVGLVKLIAGRRGRLLGAHVVGPHAGEMIAFLSFALKNRATMGQLAGFVAPYPTLSETIKRAAVDYYKDAAGSPWLRRWLALVRLFR